MRYVLVLLLSIAAWIVALTWVWFAAPIDEGLLSTAEQLLIA